MLSSAQREEFDRRGLLRLPATIPSAEVTAMRALVPAGMNALSAVLSTTSRAAGQAAS